jgi:hypothetical protein
MRRIPFGMDSDEALEQYRRHVSDLARALLAGHDPSVACARERATLDVGGVAGLHAVSSVVAKHNPSIPAAVRLLRSVK